MKILENLEVIYITLSCLKEFQKKIDKNYYRNFNKKFENHGVL